MISIIVPVYNAEKFVEECVRSIQRQDYTDWELLLVNDGSTDNSLAICRKLALAEPRITVIDKEHKGVSDARNTALGRIRGEYICFIDADDTVDPDYLSKLYSGREFDMVICGYTVDNYDQDGILLNTTECIPDVVEIKHLSENRAQLKPFFFSGMININCNKLLKADIINKHGLRYRQIPVNEDFCFMLDYLNVAESVGSIPNAGYHWIRLQSNKSGVDSLPENLVEIYTQAHRDLISFFGSETTAHELMYYSYYFVIIKYCIAIINKNISRKAGLNKLKSIMDLKPVKNAFATRIEVSRGEKFMNFLLKHKLFRLFIASNKYLKVI